MTTWRFIAVSIAAATCFSSVGDVQESIAAPSAERAPLKTVPMPLNHFVYIIQENITFDHYFGTFPGADGIPKGAKFAYQPGEAPSVAPFHLHQTSIPHDLNHSWQAAHVAADGGKM